MDSGVLTTPPHPRRSTVGVTTDGRLLVDQVAMIATWQGSSQRRPMTGLNQPAGPEGVSLFTSAWGSVTPAANDTVEVALDSLPAGRAAHGPDRDRRSPRSPPAVRRSRLAEPCSSGAAPSAGRLATEAQVGQQVTVRLVLRPQWNDVADAVGGGPLIVQNGRPDLPGGGGVHRHPALASPRTDRGRPAGRREDRPRRGRRRAARLQHGDDELRARAAARAARSRDRERARLGHLDDDGLRREADQPSVRPRRRARSRRRPVRLLLRRPGAGAGDRRPLAERRRGRRGAAAQLQGRAPVDRDREPGRPGRRRPPDARPARKPRARTRSTGQAAPRRARPSPRAAGTGS